MKYRSWGGFVSSGAFIRNNTQPLFTFTVQPMRPSLSVTFRPTQQRSPAIKPVQVLFFVLRPATRSFGMEPSARADSWISFASVQGGGGVRFGGIVPLGGVSRSFLIRRSKSDM
jgi:hypothetical protein